MFIKSALTLFFCFFASLGWASPWSVERTTAGASYSLDGQNWTPIRNQIEIPNTSWIHTSGSARVQLRRNAERIVIQPNSLLAITTWEENGQNTRVDQRMGVIFLDVETHTRQHTFVNTPHLAAVVKGTAFEVSVNDGGSTVRVERGQVAVSSRGSERSMPVGPGQSASVSSGGSPAAGPAAQTPAAQRATTATGTTVAGAGSPAAGNQPGNVGTNANGAGNNGNGTGSNGNGNGNAGNNGNGAGTNGNVGTNGNAGTNGNVGTNANGAGNNGNVGTNANVAGTNGNVGTNANGAGNNGNGTGSSKNENGNAGTNGNGAGNKVNAKP